jgi:ABC-2 type transport system ATP-binding protein
MEKLLEIKDLSYKKNHRQILHDLNLEIDSNRIVALLGENGAGKTTLMRIIAGVAKNYHGRVAVSGVTDESQRKAKLAFTDNLTGFPSSTKIKQVVAFYQDVYPDFDQEEFRQLRQFMKLDLEMKLSQLSRGMREKLIIALTFARKVDLYLLDEPLAGIDVMARKRIINSIILWKEKESTILISDHFVNELTSLLDEVVIIKDHTVKAHQSADQIRSHGQSIDQFYEGFYQGDELDD